MSYSNTENPLIVVVNIGTPEKPTYLSVQKFLKAFLSDREVVRLPRAIWNVILYGFILPIRPLFVTQYYKKIWTKHGSLLKYLTTSIASKLQTRLKHIKQNNAFIRVIAGMTYGNPSLKEALLEGLRQKANPLIILPLFPVTSLSTFDPIMTQVNEFKTRNAFSAPVIVIKEYGLEEDYLALLKDSVLSSWQENGRSQHLIISFHSLPKRYILLGDTYYARAKLMAQKIAQRLNLSENDWTIAFQSRLGPLWLKPDLSALIKKLPKMGIKTLDVLSPAFAVDCLETKAEIEIQNAEIFSKNGGLRLQYINALNDSDRHIEWLKSLILKYF